MAQSNPSGHPWYVTRCSSCRTFVISSAPKCPNCGAWRASARAVQVAGSIIVGAALLASFVFLVQSYVKTEQMRIEERAALLQSLASKSP